MAEQGEASPAGEAKSVTGDFIQSLGLLELIVGGVGAYAIWLWYAARTPTLFPSTGTKFIDIALLAFGAAIVGKMICLLVAAGMGLVRSLIKFVNPFDYSIS